MFIEGNISISAFRDTGFPNAEKTTSKKHVSHRNLGETYNEAERKYILLYIFLFYL